MRELWLLRGQPKISCSWNRHTDRSRGQSARRAALAAMAQACWPSAIVRMGHVAVPSTCHHDGCNPTQPGVCTAQTTLQQPTHRARSLVRACRDPEARGPTRLLGRALRFSIMRLYRWPPSHAKGPGGGEPDKPAAAVGLPVAVGDWQAAGRGRVRHCPGRASAPA